MTKHLTALPALPQEQVWSPAPTLPVTLVPGHLVLSSALWKHCARIHKLTHRQHTQFFKRIMKILWKLKPSDLRNAAYPSSETGTQVGHCLPLLLLGLHETDKTFSSRKHREWSWLRGDQVWSIRWQFHTLLTADIINQPHWSPLSDGRLTEFPYSDTNY